MWWKKRTGCTILLLVMLLLSGGVLAQSQVPANALADVEKVAKTYEVEIVTVEPHFPVAMRSGKIDGHSADKSLVENYAPLFVAEFTLYPPDLVKRTKLKRIVFCKDLAFAGQLRNAIPDFEHDTLYLEVDRGSRNKTYLRKVIHHEFFHIIDYRDDGSVYRDPRWAALNPAEFKYGTGGSNAQNIRSTSVLTDMYPGFLNHYSTTGVEEDKAEIFANLIVDTTYVEGRILTDAVLQTKVKRMKELLVEFCPDMKETFWDKVHKMKREAPPSPPRDPVPPMLCAQGG
jgi:hypothetical protein